MSIILTLPKVLIFLLMIEGVSILAYNYYLIRLLINSESKMKIVSIAYRYGWFTKSDVELKSSELKKYADARLVDRLFCVLRVLQWWTVILVVYVITHPEYLI
jgi:hypothetical protein